MVDFIERCRHIPSERGDFAERDDALGIRSRRSEREEMETEAWLAEAAGCVAGDSAKGQAAAVRECPELASAKTFLQSRPPGVYTCARAVGPAGGSSPSEVVVLWSFHLQRLASGLESVDAAMKASTSWVESMQRVTGELVTNVLARWHQSSQHGDGMLSVLWWRHAANDNTPGPPGPAGYSIAVHMCPMPQPKCLASTVLVFGDGRDNARCKHTKWIEDRKPIEKRMSLLAEYRGSPIHEVVLSKAGSGGDRLLLEGLISNFYVVKDNTLFTAGEGVLEGSTRELVLKACNDLGIPVVLKAPRLSERKDWQAAFVTSSVRVVIDVTRLLWEEGEGEKKVLREAAIPSETSGFTQQIRDQIATQRMYLN